MKILQVGSSLFDWGGIERYVAYLSQGLSDRGHRVQLTCPKNSFLDERVKLRKHHIALKGQFHLPPLVRYLRLFREQRYDVVHIHFSPDFIMPAIAARMTKQKCKIMTRHLALPWSATQVRRYTRLFDRIIAVSDATKKHLVDSGVPSDFVVVAKAGCPALLSSLSPEEARQEYRVKAGSLVLGYFGRLVEEKGVDTLISAMHHLPEHVSLFIFGDGPMRSELETLAGALQAADRIRFYGFISEVAEAMSMVDAVVVPSRWEEAFPYAVLEAMSLGKPVLASNVGGLPEMVVNQRTGLLFEKDDPDDLARSVRRLEEIPNLADALSQGAKRLHATEYTVGHMSERIESVYRETIGLLRKRG